MLTFADARQTVMDRWPDYDIAPYGFETDANWILGLLPETTGGRIPAVSKTTGTVTWISAYSPEYDQSRPVGLDSHGGRMSHSQARTQKLGALL